MGDDYRSVSVYDEGTAQANQVTAVLDELERRVEHFREQAASLVNEKESILRCLHILQESSQAQNLSKCDKADLEVTSERLVCRCLTVDIAVNVPRSDSQEEALQVAHRYVEEVRAKGQPPLLQALLSACSSDHLPNAAPVDQRFQTLLLGCTAEDQKNIRKQLRQYLNEL